MQLMHVHLNKYYVLFSNEHQVQNQYMKVILSYALNRKQTTQTFLVNNKKIMKKIILLQYLNQKLFSDVLTEPTRYH